MVPSYLFTAAWHCSNSSKVPTCHPLCWNCFFRTFVWSPTCMILVSCTIRQSASVLLHPRLRHNCQSFFLYIEVENAPISIFSQHCASFSARLSAGLTVINVGNWSSFVHCPARPSRGGHRQLHNLDTWLLPEGCSFAIHPSCTTAAMKLKGNVAWINKIICPV